MHILLLLFLAWLPAALGHGAELHQPAIDFELAADPTEVPMRLVDGRVIVDVMIDGKGPFPFIFDTGAHGGVMDLTFAREQGLQLGRDIMVGSPGGKGLPGNQVTIKQLRMGGLALNRVTSVAFDGLPFERNETSPRGVLSPYGLIGLLVTIDYPGKKLVFRRGALPEPDGREVFGWDLRAGLPEIPTTVAGIPISVHLDSGASTALTLPNALAQRLPLDGPLVEMGYSRMVDQVKAVQGAPLRGELTFGRYTVENPMVRFVDMAKDIGVVGGAVMSQFAVTIDPANARLRLAGPSSGLIQVSDERKPRYGIHLDALDANPLRVRLIDASSPAEKGGLRAGDQIVTINGRPVRELGIVERLNALKAPSLAVMVNRDNTSLAITMKLE